MANFPLTENTHTYLRFQSKLPNSTLVLNELRGEEMISGLFKWEWLLYSKDASIDFSALLNTTATANFEVQHLKRYINGLVTEVVQGPTTPQKTGQVTFYTLTVRPTLWRLTLTTNCRIFQDKTTVEIIEKILDEHGIHKSIRVQSAGRAVREYCVQYDESDFNFISRLMEEEGIFYFFEHTESEHLLILGDDISVHTPCKDAETSACVHKTVMRAPFNHVVESSLMQQVVPKTFTARDYNYTQPDETLQTETPGHGQVGELYHYPGDYQTVSAGMGVTKTRIQAQEAPEKAFTGRSTIPFLCPGFKTTVKDHLRKDANGAYVIKRVVHRISIEGETLEGVQPSNPQWELQDVSAENTFEMFPATVPFRPPYTTRRPKIYGTQTAKVTGPDGEVIWTDKYGRIKVEFHWDRYSPHNEHSSCWIRVAQGWAGNDWGILFTPRIGHEVVVTFLNGDPDRPLVTASVYNANYMPDYVPRDPTMSSIKTNTVPGGEGFNEIRFQDKKEEEELYFHAQRDHKTIVRDGSRYTYIQAKAMRPGNDLVQLTRGDRELHIIQGNQFVLLNDGNRSIVLDKGNETTLLMDGNRTATLMKGDDVTTLMDGNRMMTLENGNEIHFNNGNFVQTVTKDYNLMVLGDMSIEVTGLLNITVGQAMTVEVGEGIEVTAGEDIAVTAGMGIEVTAGEEIAVTAGLAMELTAGLALTVTAGAAVAVTAGGAVAVTAGGAVAVDAAAAVMINAGAAFEIMAPLKGKITALGGLTFHGLGMLKI